MRVLVTGGSGFVGQALVPALLHAGHRVQVLSRQPQLPAALEGASHVRDLAQADDSEAVINLAGANLFDRRWNDAYRQTLRDSRIRTTQALGEHLAQQANPPKILISGSAIGYYGPQTHAQPLDESAPAGTDFAAQLCKDWEDAAIAGCPADTRLIRLRIGVVLGPGGALTRMLPPFKLGLGGRLGDGKQMFSWIHREDLVALILALMAAPNAQGAVNATAPEAVSNATLSKTLGQVLHRPAVLPMPAFALRGLVGEAAGILLTGQNVVPAQAQAMGFRFAYPTLAAALRQLLPRA